MAQATGTLAWLNDYLSDTPADIDVIQLRATEIAIAISAIANDLNDKLTQTPGPIDEKLEEQAIAQVEALNRELERLLEIKRRLDGQSRVPAPPPRITAKAAAGAVSEDSFTVMDGAL